MNPLQDDLHMYPSIFTYTRTDGYALVPAQTMCTLAYKILCEVRQEVTRQKVRWYCHLPGAPATSAGTHSGPWFGGVCPAGGAVLESTRRSAPPIDRADSLVNSEHPLRLRKDKMPRTLGLAIGGQSTTLAGRSHPGLFCNRNFSSFQCSQIPNQVLTVQNLMKL